MYVVSRCKHLTLGGARCTYPSLLSKEFCYNHEHRRFRRRRRRVPILPDTHELAGPLVTFVYMEDYASILENLNSTFLAFAEHFIDHRQVTSLTYLMNTAIKTVDRLQKLEKLRNEDMPRQVAYDDLENPVAADPVQSTDSQPAADPESATTADTRHPESASAEEEPGLSESAQPASQMGSAPDHVSAPTEQDPEEAARRAFQDRNYDEMHRKLNPHFYPTLNAAADPFWDLPCCRLQATGSITNNLPPDRPITNPFSDTCVLRPSTTTADSYTCHFKGV